MYKEWCFKNHSCRIWWNQGECGRGQEQCSSWTTTNAIVAHGAAVSTSTTRAQLPGRTFEDDAVKNLRINATAS